MVFEDLVILEEDNDLYTKLVYKNKIIDYTSCTCFVIYNMKVMDLIIGKCL